MTDLKEIRTKVDYKIEELRQQAYFAINKYDYHHKNDELQILEQQIEILGQVTGTYTRFLNEMQKFNQTLNDAKQMSAEFDQLLGQLEPTTQHQSLSPPNENERQLQQQHEMQATTAKSSSKNLKHPLTCTKKDKLKDSTSKKQLFPPS
ncbi:uncharacterized protein LOC129944318 [Eupeodes corollae]|uniref:uncharacterized protein LOC129944318 n=1 Tax=Eupeodes corollae TaxID=290404 RepID=UPI002491544A|nr:uncharacterized protein LOC129944318 [Eupeodes corollae]